MNKPPYEDKKPKYPPPFSMRFTEDERRVLEMAADGRPFAAYIRWLIFKEDMPELPKRRTREQMDSLEFKELSMLLGTLGKSRISQNINQLAKAQKPPRSFGWVLVAGSVYRRDTGTKVENRPGA